MSLVFQDDGCSRFVSSQYLSNLLTSHALFGDSKKTLFSVLWTDLGNFANTGTHRLADR